MLQEPLELNATALSSVNFNTLQHVVLRRFGASDSQSNVRSMCLEQGHIQDEAIVEGPSLHTRSEMLEHFWVSISDLIYSTLLHVRRSSSPVQGSRRRGRRAMEPVAEEPSSSSLDRGGGTSASTLGLKYGSTVAHQRCLHCNSRVCFCCFPLSP